MRLKMNAQTVLVGAAVAGVAWVLWTRYKAAHYTSPMIWGGYSNPAGEDDNYRGTVLPPSLRGGQ